MVILHKTVLRIDYEENQFCQQIEAATKDPRPWTESAQNSVSTYKSGFFTCSLFEELSKMSSYKVKIEHVTSALDASFRDVFNGGLGSLLALYVC